jgi:translation initiation factor IF-2
VRQRVSSMQIERKDVGEANAGDSVGIKVDTHVPVGSKVYKLKDTEL